ISRVLSWLHPFDGWTETPRVWHALDLAERGEVERASEILKNISHSQSPLAASATGYWYRIQARWEEALAWARVRVASTVSRRDVNLMALLLRALGETGELRAMLGFFADCEGFLLTAQMPFFLNQLRMMVFAFCGKT